MGITFDYSKSRAIHTAQKNNFTLDIDPSNLERLNKNKVIANIAGEETSDIVFNTDIVLNTVITLKGRFDGDIVGRLNTIKIDDPGEGVISITGLDIKSSRYIYPLDDSLAGKLIAKSNRVIGSESSDLIREGAGDDTLIGYRGRDTLDGGAGNDLIRGGRGIDMVSGGEGTDKVYGGMGDDMFFVNAGDGFDRIMDYGRGDDQVLINTVDLADVSLKTAGKKGNSTKVYIGDDHAATLKGIRMDTLELMETTDDAVAIVEMI